MILASNSHFFFNIFNARRHDVADLKKKLLHGIYAYDEAAKKITIIRV